MSSLMYFATGDGGNAIGESYTAPSDKLYSIHPISATTLELVFDSGHGYFDSVILTITSGKHKTVIGSINNAINQAHKSLIAVCDSDNSSFLNSNITDCVISLSARSTGETEGQAHPLTIKQEITVSYDRYDSLSICNIAASADVSVDLWITDMRIDVGYLVDSGINFAEAGTADTIVALDTTASASLAIHTDLFLGERLYSVPLGTLFGICTTVTALDEIIVDIKSTIVGNEDIFVGERFYLLNNVVIPNGATLKLSGDEFNFDRDGYRLYIQPTVGSAIQTILR